MNGKFWAVIMMLAGLSGWCGAVEWVVKEGDVKMTQGDPATLKASDCKPGETIAVQGPDGALAVVWGGRGGKFALDGLTLAPGKTAVMQVKRIEFPEKPKSWIGIYYRLANAQNCSYNFTMSSSGVYISEHQPAWRSIGGHEVFATPFTLKSGRTLDNAPALSINDRNLFTGKSSAEAPYDQIKFECLNPMADDITLIEFGPVSVE